MEGELETVIVSYLQSGDYQSKGVSAPVQQFQQKLAQLRNQHTDLQVVAMKRRVVEAEADVLASVQKCATSEPLRDQILDYNTANSDMKYKYILPYQCEEASCFGYCDLDELYCTAIINKQLRNPSLASSQARQYIFVPVRIPDDGNCFVHVLAAHVRDARTADENAYPEEFEDPSQLQNKIADLILASQDTTWKDVKGVTILQRYTELYKAPGEKYAKDVEFENLSKSRLKAIIGDFQKDFRKGTGKMRSSSAWNDELMIAAASILLKIRVRIHSEACCTSCRQNDSCTAADQHKWIAYNSRCKQKDTLYVMSVRQNSHWLLFSVFAELRREETSADASEHSEHQVTVSSEVSSSITLSSALGGGESTASAGEAAATVEMDVSGEESIVLAEREGLEDESFIEKRKSKDQATVTSASEEDSIIVTRKCEASSSESEEEVKPWDLLSDKSSQPHDWVRARWPTWDKSDSRWAHFFATDSRVRAFGVMMPQAWVLADQRQSGRTGRERYCYKLWKIPFENLSDEADVDPSRQVASFNLLGDAKRMPIQIPVEAFSSREVANFLCAFMSGYLHLPEAAARMESNSHLRTLRTVPELEYLLCHQLRCHIRNATVRRPEALWTMNIPSEHVTCLMGYLYDTSEKYATTRAQYPEWTGCPPAVRQVIQQDVCNRLFGEQGFGTLGKDEAVGLNVLIPVIAAILMDLFSVSAVVLSNPGVEVQVWGSGSAKEFVGQLNPVGVLDDRSNVNNTVVIGTAVHDKTSDTSRRRGDPTYLCEYWGNLSVDHCKRG